MGRPSKGSGKRKPHAIGFDDATYDRIAREAERSGATVNDWINSAVASRFRDLDSGSDAIGGDLPPSTDPRVVAHAAWISTLSKRAREAEARADALSKRLADLEARVSKDLDAGFHGAILETRSRVEALEQAHALIRREQEEHNDAIAEAAPREELASVLARVGALEEARLLDRDQDAFNRVDLLKRLDRLDGMLGPVGSKRGPSQYYRPRRESMYSTKTNDPFADLATNKEAGKK